VTSRIRAECRSRTVRRYTTHRVGRVKPVRDQRGPYFRSLVESERARSYWTGIAPEDPGERWFFETIQDEGRSIAVRQIAVSPDRSLGYSADHLEDEHGFLTDQPVEPMAFGLDAVDAATFERVWSERTNK
jgi:hypothetical protein